MKGIDGCTFSWMGFSHSCWSLQRGRNVDTSAMSTPSPMPPPNAHGRLTSRPTAAAAIATTMMLKYSFGSKVVKRGAMSTPASPAKNDDRAHADADTRSAEMPLSSVIRGLSTTAFILRPTGVSRNRAASPRTATTATTMATSSSRLNGYTPNGS